MEIRSFALAALLCASAAGQDAASPDPKERVRTARELSRGGSQAIPRLAPLLRDPVLEVRIEAVKSMVEIGTQYSLESLVEATRDNDPEIQIRATDGLVNFYLPGYVRTGLSASLRRMGASLTSRWSDSNDQVIDAFIQVRPEIVQALGRLARGGSSMDSRANAARAVGILRGAGALDDLIQALRSKDDRVLYECLIAIQKIREPGAAPRISFLLRDLNEKVQIAAIETTGLLRNKEALPALRDALARARSKKVRRAALTAIAMLPDESSREVFRAHFQDGDDGLRAAAAEGFARLANPADLPMLEKAFAGEGKMNPRLSLAFALVSLGKYELSEFSPLTYLVNNLNSRSWRGVAYPFLVELARRPPVLAALHGAAARGTRDEKMWLSQVLARSGTRDSLPVLEGLSRDPDAEVAQEALRALRSLRSRLG